jgi:hypothetical protein
MGLAAVMCPLVCCFIAWLSETEIPGDMVMIANTFVDKKTSVIIHTVTGKVTFAQIKSSYEAVLSHPDFQDDMCVIWDIIDADASEFDSQDVIRLARYFETQLKHR